jgi:hypothetical protein
MLRSVICYKLRSVICYMLRRVICYVTLYVICYVALYVMLRSVLCYILRSVVCYITVVKLLHNISNIQHYVINNVTYKMLIFNQTFTCGHAFRRPYSRNVSYSLRKVPLRTETC